MAEYESEPFGESPWETHDREWREDGEAARPGRSAAAVDFTERAFSAEPSDLTADEITVIFGPTPAVAALHWLLSSPKLRQATLAALQGGAARRSVRIHGSDMPVPHYLRFLSRLFREAAEQSEAQVADETAWGAETEAAPEPDLPLRYQRHALGEAEAGSRTSPAYVRWIQQALNQLGGARLVEDGRIGPITRAVVVSFQRTHGLKPDGIVGPLTEPALAAASDVLPPPAPPLGTNRAPFGNYNVVSDHSSGPRQLNDMTQTDYLGLSAAWTNIQNNRGMLINGTAADQAAFRIMLRDGMQISPTMRQTISDIGNNTTHPVTVNVGRSQPGVIIDSFGTNDTDLDDLDRLSATPTAGHSNESTRPEFIEHFLAEREFAANNPGTLFGPAHAAGVAAQNNFRAERGGSAVTGQVFAGTDAAGNIIGRTNFSDGTHQDEIINSGTGNIVRIDRP